uniref:Interleukin 11a n=1 Tax=Oryzias melastigma TaxID=30732 RepID=A0A3B3C800_ORYME
MSAHINSFTGSLCLYFEADFCGANLSICLVFAVIHESALCLLRLLLLVELFARSSAHPGQNFSLCSVFGPMIHQVDKLINSSKRLHGLTEDDLKHFEGMDHKLESLPHIRHTAVHFSSLKVNESLSLLYGYTESFKLHVGWLKTVRENFSLPFQSDEGAINHLSHLSNLINTSLHQVKDVPLLPSSSPFPDVPTAFDATRLSVEISEQLKVFCRWSKRVLLLFRRRSGCGRH